MALQERRLINQGFIKPRSIQIEGTLEMKPIEALIVQNKIEDACISIVEACKADLKTIFENVSLIQNVNLPPALDPK